MELLGADRLGGETIRRGVDVLGELADVAQIPIDGVGGVVANLHVFEQALPSGGQRADALHEPTPCV